MIPLKQYYFLLGVQPDSIILCINGYDSIEYVRRTILEYSFLFDQFALELENCYEY